MKIKNFESFFINSVKVLNDNDLRYYEHNIRSKFTEYFNNNQVANVLIIPGTNNCIDITNIVQDLLSVNVNCYSVPSNYFKVKKLIKLSSNLSYAKGGFKNIKFFNGEIIQQKVQIDLIIMPVLFFDFKFNYSDFYYNYNERVLAALFPEKVTAKKLVYGFSFQRISEDQSENKNNIADVILADTYCLKN